MTTPRRPLGGRPTAGRRPARQAGRSATRSAEPSAGSASADAAAQAPSPSGGSPSGGSPSGGTALRRTAGPRRSRPRAGRARVSPGRAAVLVLVVVTLLVSAFLPLRELIRQRGQIDQLAQSNRDARTRVAELEAERGRLQDPAHLAAEARRRLHFVLPGETAYILLEPTPDPAAADASSDRPWYSQLWDSARRADVPAEAPAREPAPAPVPTVDPSPGVASDPAVDGPAR